MTELGATSDPRVLIPGLPEVIEEHGRVLRARADHAARAAEGLRGIDTGSWEGPAARAFHDKFSYEPAKWFTAADSLEAAAAALENYAGTLRWAQRQADEAIRLWNHGQAAATLADPGAEYRQAARDILGRARAQVSEAGDVAAGILRGEADAAPVRSSWLDEVGDGLATAGAHVINGVASLGNALLHHPGEALVAGAGVGLAALSATGELAGVALDATGVGAVGGVPLNVVSAAGILTGVGMAGAAMANIASHAAGDDRVAPVDTDDAEQDAAAVGEPPREITGFTSHGEAQAMGRDGGRGVSDAAMEDAVAHPVEPVERQEDPRGPKYVYRGRDAVVILNHEGRVVTTHARHATGLRNR